MSVRPEYFPLMSVPTDADLCAGVRRNNLSTARKCLALGDPTVIATFSHPALTGPWRGRAAATPDGAYWIVAFAEMSALDRGWAVTLTKSLSVGADVYAVGLGARQALCFCPVLGGQYVGVVVAPRPDGDAAHARPGKVELYGWKL